MEGFINTDFAVFLYTLDSIVQLFLMQFKNLDDHEVNDGFLDFFNNKLCFTSFDCSFWTAYEVGSSKSVAVRSKKQKLAKDKKGVKNK